MIRKSGLVALSLAILAWNPSTSAAENTDQLEKQMTRIASDSGCFLCHNVRTTAPSQSGPLSGTRNLALGPAWRDVAKKYAGQKGAAQRLTRTVMQGTGRRPGDRHLKNAGADRMPPNAGEISEANARKLVRWILTLER